MELLWKFHGNGPISKFPDFMMHFFSSKCKVLVGKKKMQSAGSKTNRTWIKLSSRLISNFQSFNSWKLFKCSRKCHSFLTNNSDVGFKMGDFFIFYITSSPPCTWPPSPCHPPPPPSAAWGRSPSWWPRETRSKNGKSGETISNCPRKVQFSQMSRLSSAEPNLGALKPKWLLAHRTIPVHPPSHPIPLNFHLSLLASSYHESKGYLGGSWTDRC